MHHLVMLNEVQRSEASILVSSLSLGMTTKGMLGITPPCHAERSEASIMDSSLSLGMTTKGMLGMHHLVMLNEALAK